MTSTPLSVMLLSAQSGLSVMLTIMHAPIGEAADLERPVVVHLAVAAADGHDVRLDRSREQRDQLRPEGRRRVVVGRDRAARNRAAPGDDRHVVHVVCSDRHARLAEFAVGARHRRADARRCCRCQARGRSAGTCRPRVSCALLNPVMPMTVERSTRFAIRKTRSAGSPLDDTTRPRDAHQPRGGQRERDARRFRRRP